MTLLPHPIIHHPTVLSIGPVQLTGRTRTDHIVVFDGNPRLAGQTEAPPWHTALKYHKDHEAHQGHEATSTQGRLSP